MTATKKNDQILQATVIIRVEAGLPGQQRKVDAQSTIKEETGTDPEILRVTKKLYDGCSEFGAIVSALNEAKRYVRTRAVPSASLKHGYSRLPLALVESTDDWLRNYRDNVLTPLIDTFVEKYPAIVERAKVRLGTLADQADFASVADVRKRFVLDWTYLTLDTPDSLKEVSAALFNREREKAAQQVEAEFREVRLGLTEGMSTLVDRMVERLTPDADGKPKIFRNSLVANMREFLDLFEAKNITNDDALAKLTAKAKQILAGNLEADTLRKDESIRNKVRASLESVQSELVTLKKTRSLDLDEDE